MTKKHDTSVWTTADGRATKVVDLETSHLRNIIRDGYRNKDLIAEAKKRGIPVPDVEHISFADLMMMKEAVASCAIEGIESPLTDAIVKMIDDGAYEKAAAHLSVLRARNAFDKCESV